MSDESANALDGTDTASGGEYVSEETFSQAMKEFKSREGPPGQGTGFPHVPSAPAPTSFAEYSEQRKAELFGEQGKPLTPDEYNKQHAEWTKKEGPPQTPQEHAEDLGEPLYEEKDGDSVNRLYKQDIPDLINRWREDEAALEYIAQNPMAVLGDNPVGVAQQILYDQMMMERDPGYQEQVAQQQYEQQVATYDYQVLAAVDGPLTEALEQAGIPVEGPHAREMVEALRGQILQIAHQYPRLLNDPRLLPHLAEGMKEPLSNMVTGWGEMLRQWGYEISHPQYMPQLRPRAIPPLPETDEGQPAKEHVSETEFIEYMKRWKNA